MIFLSSSPCRGEKVVGEILLVGLIINYNLGGGFE